MSTARALAALHALREAYAWLQDEHDAATVASLPARAPARRLSQQGAAARDRALRVERADRLVIEQSGAAAGMGASPMPIRADLVDAQDLALRAIVDCAWLTASELHRTPRHWAVDSSGGAVGVWYPRERMRGAGGPWAAACAHLAAQLPHVGPRLAVAVAVELERADTAVRGALRVGPAWYPLPGVECPGCEGRTVEAECSSLNERDWSMRCSAGCWTDTARAAGAQLGRLGDLLALVASVRRQMHRRGRRAAA